MLYALRHPITLVGLLLGFLVGSVAHGLAQAWVARRAGDRYPWATGRGSADPRRHIDPFGAVAAALVGVGWPAPVVSDWRRYRSRGRLVAVALAGPVTNFLLAAAGLAGYVAAGGTATDLQFVDLSSALHGSQGFTLPAAQVTLLLFGLVNLAMAVLSFVPLPPLEATYVGLSFAPRTIGWQRAEHTLVEQNWGVGILLLLLLLPIAGEQPLLFVLLEAVIHPLLGAVSGW